MFITGRQYKVSNLISIFTVVLAFYAFGVFGFFNLFGARRIVQIVVALYMFFPIAVILYNYQFFLKNENKYLLGTIIFFFIYYGIMISIIKGEFLTTYLNSLVMMLFCLLLISMEMKYIKKIAESIVVITFVLSLMAFIGYIAFFIDSTLIHKVKFDLYHSEIGSEMIYPHHWIEYLTFTSGEGFFVFDIGSVRMKGFSNEPSSTLVHYLAPVGLAFLLSQKYKIMGFIILIINIIAIASLMAWIVVFLSFLFYCLLKIKSVETIKSILYLGIFMMLFMMLNFDFTYTIFMKFGNLINEVFGIDLIARKAGSLDTRLLGYIDGVKYFISNPLGGAFYLTGTGLILNVSLVGGIFLFFIMILFLVKMIKFSICKYKGLDQKSEKFGVSFILSIVFVVMFLSSYGWNHIPGVIMLIVFFRLMKDLMNLKVYNLGANSAV